MGKGDIKSRKGKISNGSSGVSRQKKKKTFVIPSTPKKAAKVATAVKEEAPAKKAAPKKKATAAKKTTTTKTTTKKTTTKKATEGKA